MDGKNSGRSAHVGPPIRTRHKESNEDSDRSREGNAVSGTEVNSNKCMGSFPNKVRYFYGILFKY